MSQISRCTPLGGINDPCVQLADFADWLIVAVAQVFAMLEVASKTDLFYSV